MSEEKKLPVEITTLAEIVYESNQIEEALIRSGGEITPEIEKMIAIVDTKLPAKVEGYVGIVRRMERLVMYYEDLANRFIRLAQGAGDVAGSCKSRMQEAMETMGVKEINGIHARFALQSTKAVEIEDEKKIPGDYIVTETVTKIEKKRIAEDLKRGVTVPGASFKENHHVRIYNKGPK